MMEDDPSQEELTSLAEKVAAKLADTKGNRNMAVHLKSRDTAPWAKLRQKNDTAKGREETQKDKWTKPTVSWRSENVDKRPDNDEPTWTRRNEETKTWVSQHTGKPPPAVEEPP